MSFKSYTQLLVFCWSYMYHKKSFYYKGVCIVLVAYKISTTQQFCSIFFFLYIYKNSNKDKKHTLKNY